MSVEKTSEKPPAVSVGSTALFGDWSSMETAPINGTEVLVLSPDGIDIAAFQKCDDYKRAPKMWCVRGSWGDEQGGFSTVSPTHWMPLPSLPNVEVTQMRSP